MTVTRQPTDIKFKVSRDGGGVGDADLTALTGATSDNIVAAAKLAADGSTVNGLKTSSATGGLGYATGAGGAVAQASTITTGVTLSTLSGQITTVASTLGALSSTLFVVTNTLVVATDVIVLSTTYAGAGSPVLQAITVGAGVFTISISNGHASAALNAALVINFAVIKAVAA